MTLPMARDLGRLGIRVNCLLPGVFDTPMTQPIKQFRPEVYKPLGLLSKERMRMRRMRNLAASPIFPTTRLGASVQRLTSNDLKGLNEYGNRLLQGAESLEVCRRSSLRWRWRFLRTRALFIQKELRKFSKGVGEVHERRVRPCGWRHPHEQAVKR